MNEHLYPQTERFPKVSINSILIQWTCLENFLSEQIKNKKSLSLSEKQVKGMREIRENLLNNEFKFFFLVLKQIVDELTSLNKLFQSKKSQLHLIFPLSRKILNKFMNIIYKDEVKVELGNLQKLQQKMKDSRLLVDNESFLQNLENQIDFDQTFIEYSVDISIVSDQTLEFSKLFISKFCFLLTNYLPTHDQTIEAFQLLDPRKRNIIPSSLFMFREKLLKKFILCYGFENYEETLKEYQEFIQCEDFDLPVNFGGYISQETGYFKIENFWIDRNNQTEWKYKLLSKFFTNLMVISHSNMYVESMFSHIGNIKAPLRNKLEVGSVESIMKVKSYYR